MLELSTCPQLSLLSNTNPEYIEIENHIRNTMSLVKIIAIIKIHLPKEPKNWSKKITQRVYHGTRAKCDPNDILEYGICCSDEFCGMCGILNYGNKSKFSKRGKNMWFSKSASIANSFSFNLNLPQDYLRTIFVIDVLNVSDNDTDIIIINHDNATLQRFLILYEF
ncbi:330_t:CDS:2 [Diversispora eburnea]|uniref:330_t:CDS:1 n=1 Tax=Diversispora eburnea TaxID=1213867 RepID=A0A9N8ZVS0_9GLOM|nr:330_t:CDS:2 [Diversispora eburnea]